MPIQFIFSKVIVLGDNATALQLPVEQTLFAWFAQLIGVSHKAPEKVRNYDLTFSLKVFAQCFLAQHKTYHATGMPWDANNPKGDPLIGWIHPTKGRIYCFNG